MRLPHWGPQRHGGFRVSLRQLAVVAAILVISGCAKRTPPPASPATPAFPGFEFPAVPGPIPGVSPQLAAQHQLSWNLLQRGDPRGAARAFANLVKQAPAFYPAVTGQAYAELANRDYDSAASLFNAALVQHPQYVPALAGRVDALLADDKPLEAITALEALLAVDPSAGPGP